MIDNAQVLNVYIPSPKGEGRLFVTRKYPEASAAAHIHTHVGVNIDGTNNIDKQTPIYLQDDTVFYLVPSLKRIALFFIEP